MITLLSCDLTPFLPGDQIQSFIAGGLFDQARSLQMENSLSCLSPREVLHEEAEAGAGGISWELAQPVPVGIPSGPVMSSSWDDIAASGVESECG